MLTTVQTKKKYTKPTAYIGLISRDKIVIIETENCNENAVKNVFFEYAESLAEIENEYILCNKKEFHELETCIPKDD